MAKLSALYAAALFELAVENGEVDEYLEQAVFLCDTFQDDECRRILVHPHITTAQKREFFDSAFKGRINDGLFGFLYLVIDKNREVFLVPALKALIELIDRHQGKTTANILSATELSKQQAGALKKMLSEKLKKQVELSVKVDPSVIGGLYIHADGCFIDMTIKKRLRDMAAKMKEGCGA